MMSWDIQDHTSNTIKVSPKIVEFRAIPVYPALDNAIWGKLQLSLAGREHLKL